MPGGGIPGGRIGGPPSMPGGGPYPCGGMPGGGPIPGGGMPRPIKFSAWQQKVADKYERHKPPTNFLAATDTVVPQLRVRVRARGEESAATTSALDVRILWRM